MKHFDDFRRFRRANLVIWLFVGAWALIKGIEAGDWWKAALGLGLVVFAFVVTDYLRDKDKSISD